MQLVGAIKLTVAVLLAVLVTACIGALPPAEAGRKDFDKTVWRQKGDLFIRSTYQRPQARTKCHATRTSPRFKVKKYSFYLPGRHDARDCYEAWRRGAGR
jgi:hypothetical protein